MAGVYPNIPGTRFALDRDGTVAKVRATSQAWYDVTGSLPNAMTTDSATYIDLPNTVNNDWELAVAFPEPRDITGLFVEYGVGGMDNGIISSFQYSNDTTDGTDGTWNTGTLSGMLKSAGGTMKPYYRSIIGTYALTNIRGIRLGKTVGDATSTNWRIYALHLYGSLPIAGVDRLAFWDSAADQALPPAYLDFGDNPQGAVVTRQLRIKNLSGTLTANTINLQANDLANDFSNNVLLSIDNASFFSSINIGNLAPSTVSSVLYVRRTVPVAETATQRSMRLIVEAASWT